MVTHGGGGGGGARTIWDNEAAAAAGVMRRSPRCVGEFIGDPLLGRDIVLGLWDSRPISRVSLHRRPMKSPVERRSVVGTLGESRREHTTDLCGGGEERRGEKPRRRQRGERMPRPEVQAPPEIFYNESEARKYTTSSRIIEIQVSFLPVRGAGCGGILGLMFSYVAVEDYREGARVACATQRWRPQVASRHR